jgi:multidrug transporter EmrE-like cation transporter
MNASFLLGIAFGMIAALMLNIGKGVQKQKVHVFLQGRRMFARPHRRDLGVWLLGLAMTAGASVPFSFGLKFSESASAISAMTGIGLIGLTIYAVKVIGEKLDFGDGIGIALVVVGTSLIAYFGPAAQTGIHAFEDKQLILFVLPLLAVATAACLAALKIRRIHGIVYGASAGFCLGLALFLGDAALDRAGGSILGQFSNPYPYTAIVFAMMTTVVTQFGFLRGRALEVVPAFNSTAILTPILFEIAVYRIYPQGVTPWLILMIVVGVVLISRGAAARMAA